MKIYLLKNKVKNRYGIVILFFAIIIYFPFFKIIVYHKKNWKMNYKLVSNFD